MEAFSSKDLAMKAQKKFLSHIASKSMAQMLVDDTSGEVLDELYRVSKLHSGNRNEAQKVLKDLVKVAVKVAVLIKHDKFSNEELKLAQEFRKKLHNGAMTAISFQEVQTCILAGLDLRDMYCRRIYKCFRDLQMLCLA